MLSSEIILSLFLPVLVFEAALSFNPWRLMGDMGVVKFAPLMSMFKAPVSKCPGGEKSKPSARSRDDREGTDVLVALSH